MFSSGSPVRMNVMQQSTSNFSYGERPQMGLDVEFGADPASGGFFNTDYKKHDDLKQMLDSNKDGLKLEAMKRIISMLARGRNASDLFPSVVKNVVSKNIEVKKLVYVYLVRYAEEQQDLVLLSISTFQRGLKDPNQLIRASALRVLSSIRVQMIVPIVMLAIRDSSSDMSPYVRKTAAHAIPKLYSLDPEQKDELVLIIEKLLSDRTTLVVGSAVMAFEEVCPERVDLIHKNFRKLCNLLVDVDEWGQVIIINMLTRYARTQFTNPNANELKDGLGTENSEKFYDHNDDDENSSDDDKKKKRRSSSKATICSLDLDHRLLLRQAKPLLQSRNASVVMAVAQLYHHVAPHNEVNIIAQSLIRLLRGHKEVQSIVLTCIASMSTKRKSIFEPYLKSFFVRTSDSTHIMLLKLEILTNLASVTNTPMLLREFQTYINSSDRVFVAATIQAIGRCANSIKEVTDTCLSGLVQLLSNKDEHIVAESVVVIKMLLQTKAAQHFEIISQMAGLLDFITVPAARASILWLIGEYNEKVPKIAPDVLRKCAKTFCDEEDVVKLQALNLSMKLYLVNPQQTSLLCQYVFTLARYDANYDVRDRARFLRQFIFPAHDLSTIFSKNAHSIFLSPKPAPALEGKYQGRDHFQLGSLSHYLNMRANGYRDLSDFPRVASDSTLRNTVPYEDELHAQQNSSQEVVDAGKEGKYFTNKKDQHSESSDEYSSSEESSAEDEGTVKKTVTTEQKKSDEDSDTDDHSTTVSSTSQSSSDDSSSSDKGSSESESESETEKADDKNPAPQPQPVSELDLLLDLGDIPTGGTIMTPSQGGVLSPGTPGTGLYSLVEVNHIDLVGPSYINHNHLTLLNKLSGNGLGVTYRFTRSPHLFSSCMVSIELVLTNHSNEELLNIQMAPPKSLPSGMNVKEIDPIPNLQPQQSATRLLGLDCKDSTQVVDLEIQSNKGSVKISLKTPIGELIRSVYTEEKYFREECQKLRGMNEHQCNVPCQYTDDQKSLKTKIFQKLNVASIKSSDPDSMYFVGQTLSSKSLVLISFMLLPNDVKVLVNCEKMVIASMVLNEIRNAITGQN
ncbi:AP-3 complex subunit beta-2 [Episyrphus balteatus]|uniref:AP-3 complex subunit beta-2 n=1 Tax=Episyrphus balteatus TaxID=286459 RepID=UPI002485A77D|nr:AP-3 complex subunit beta-2 [Episyrphus balteatus]